jgi:clathrin heavy chain
MVAQLPHELIELLEKLVLEGNTLSENRNLQNLLIFTAIKVDKSRVMDYIARLNNFDAIDNAKLAVDSGLHEEAFAIYMKYNLVVDAVGVLIRNIGNIERVYEFADKIDSPEVWSLVAKAQMTAGMAKDSIGI